MNNRTRKTFSTRSTDLIRPKQHQINLFKKTRRCSSFILFLRSPPDYHFEVASVVNPTTAPFHFVLTTFSVFLSLSLNVVVSDDCNFNCLPKSHTPFEKAHRRPNENSSVMVKFLQHRKIKPSQVILLFQAACWLRVSAIRTDRLSSAAVSVHGKIPSPASDVELVPLR